MLRAATTAIIAASLAGCGEIPVVEFGCANGEPLCETRFLATGVDVTGVAVYQGVETWLMQDGQETTEDTVPVASGRDMLVRAFVSTEDPADVRDVVGKLNVYDGDTFVVGIEAELTAAGDSDETSLASTLNFEVPGAELSSSASYRVQLLDPDADEEPDDADLGRAEWPPGDLDPASLRMQDSVGLVRLLLIPVQYDADGSGRLPDTDDDQIALYRDYMYKTYPAAEVEIEVGEPVPYDGTVTASNGWESLLGEVTNLRNDYDADEDQYLYGIFAPEDSFDEFCAAGCIAGLSNLVGSASDYSSRASIGLGYSGTTAAETMIHEVGHAHGRSHSPGCGASGEDPDYPNEDGLLDERGYDLVEDQLKEAEENYDFMSYCGPYWVSAFTTDGLFTRIQQVNDYVGNTVGRQGPPQPWATVILAADGTATWLDDLDLTRAPGPLDHPVELLDGKGHVIGSTWAHFVPFDHLAGGTLRFPPPGAEVDAVRVDGAVAKRHW